ncbi:MAG: DUF933 domain-containing protein [Candidatus Omnitrophota bacterium]
MVKIGIFGLENIFSGTKAAVADKRIDKLKDLFKSAKKVYIETELIYEQANLSEADGIIINKDSKLDLILSDLEFVETRLSRTEDRGEKELLARFKISLEKEEFLSFEPLNDAEKKIIAPFQLFTIRPIYLVDTSKEVDKDAILLNAYNEFGYISFFTVGDKDSHGWPLKKGLTAWDAAGVIHSDIQRGFIRAEVVHYDDLIKAGHLNEARNNGLLKLENKEYVVQDGDWMLFRFNK